MYRGAAINKLPINHSRGSLIDRVYLRPALGGGNCRCRKRDQALDFSYHDDWLLQRFRPPAAAPQPTNIAVLLLRDNSPAAYARNEFQPDYSGLLLPSDVSPWIKMPRRNPGATARMFTLGG